MSGVALWAVVITIGFLDFSDFPVIRTDVNVGAITVEEANGHLWITTESVRQVAQQIS